MSRELRIVLVALVGVVALYFALGSILPTRWTVASQARIAAPPAAVRPLIVDLGQWRLWTSLPANTRPNVETVIEGEPGTVGHRITWRSGVNEAVLRLVAVEPDGVRYEYLSKVGDGSELRVLGSGSLRLVPDGDGTQVQWLDESAELGFADRWFAWFGAQQEAVRTMQQTSLAGLRSKVESPEQPKQDAPPAGK